MATNTLNPSSDSDHVQWTGDKLRDHIIQYDIRRPLRDTHIQVWMYNLVSMGYIKDNYNFWWADMVDFRMFYYPEDDPTTKYCFMMYIPQVTLDGRTIEDDNTSYDRAMKGL